MSVAVWVSLCFSVADNLPPLTSSDLDSEALHPLHDLFTSLAPSSNQLPVAFLGEMHTTTYHSHSVPNAFMASSPGHPFWMAGPVERAIKAFKDGTGGDPEHLTGPVALKESWEGWEKSGRAEKEGEVVLLDESVIYPYRSVRVL